MYRSKSTCKLIKKNKQLSYNRVRKCGLEKLKMIPGAENSNLGLHSMRIDECR